MQKFDHFWFPSVQNENLDQSGVARSKTQPSTHDGTTFRTIDLSKSHSDYLFTVILYLQVSYIHKESRKLGVQS